MVESDKELSYFINTLKKSKLVQKSITKTGFMLYEMVIPFVRYIEYHNLPLETIYQYDKYADHIQGIYSNYVLSDNTKGKTNIKHLDVYCCLMFEFLHYQSTLEEVYDKIREIKQIRQKNTTRINELLKPFDINFNKTNETLSELYANDFSIFCTAYNQKISIAAFKVPELLFRSPKNEKNRIKNGGVLLFDMLSLFPIKEDNVVENICYLETHTLQRPYLGYIRMSTFLKCCHRYLGIGIKNSFTPDEINWYKECIMLWYYNPKVYDVSYLYECKTKEEVKDALELLKQYHNHSYINVVEYKPFVVLPGNSFIPLTIKNLEYAIVEWSLQNMSI